MSGRIISEIGTILLALGMAFLVWVAAVRQEDPIISNNVQPNIPLKIIAPPDELFILDQTSLPKEIQVKLRAPQSVWQALTPGRIRASIDLSSHSAGIYNVPVRVEALDTQASVLEFVPSEITVQLEPLAARQLPVTVKIIDSPALGYFNRLPVSEPISVTVKGSAAAVEQVEQVVAEIRLNNSKESVRQTVALLPLNTDDAIVRDVTLDPPQSDLTVPIEQRFGYKDVSVKAVVAGQPDPGYWISSISVEPATVTLVGGPATLRDVTGFVETAEIDISGATQDVVKRVPLNLPPGSSTVIEENQDTGHERSVLVTVGISALTGGRTMQVDMTVQGANPTLSWTLAPETVEVILSGSLPVLQGLAKEDITVIVDLFDLVSGVHRVQPEVISPEGVDVTSLIPDTIEVTLQPAREATATPTPVPTLRATPTPRRTITPTIVATVVSTTTDTITATQNITGGTLILPRATVTVTRRITANLTQD